MCQQTNYNETLTRLQPCLAGMQPYNITRGTLSTILAPCVVSFPDPMHALHCVCVWPVRAVPWSKSRAIVKAHPGEPMYQV